jgi:hypothetical protein
MMSKTVLLLILANIVSSLAIDVHLPFSNEIVREFSTSMQAVQWMLALSVALGVGAGVVVPQGVAQGVGVPLALGAAAGGEGRGRWRGLPPGDAPGWGRAAAPTSRATCKRAW